MRLHQPHRLSRAPRPGDGIEHLEHQPVIVHRDGGLAPFLHGLNELRQLLLMCDQAQIRHEREAQMNDL